MEKTSLPTGLSPYTEDFERWCGECVMIADKLTGRPVPFRLNAPQRRLARTMERQRKAGKPVRIILLKARQWGGSTLVQAYMAWMQLVRHIGLNALVCAHVKDAALLIRSAYSLLLDCYPESMRKPDARLWKLKPYGQTQSTLWIPARQARLAITSANNPDALRGASYHLAHLSEAAFWADGDRNAASAIVRTVCGTVPTGPETVIVIESTADGPDNWFAAEWRRAVEGHSDKIPVFVPWHEIEIYRLSLTPEQKKDLPRQLDDYELRLMAQGVSAEALAWYHSKRREYTTHAEMMAEFPSTPEEAFATAARSPFPADAIGNLRTGGEDAGTIRATLLVAAIGEKFMLVESGAGSSGIHILREHAASDARSMMQTAGRILRSNAGMTLAFVEALPPRGHGHGRWCLRQAANLAMPLCYGGGDPLMMLTPDMLGELTDLQLHLLGQGRITDHTPAAAATYRIFDADSPWRSPAMMARLRAAAILERRMETAPLSPMDFIRND